MSRAAASRLLALGAGRATRELALAQLDRLRAARRALAAGDDPEALHDLRVALRRLRSLVRAFDDELAPTIGRRLRRNLRDLARATNPARDAEVGAARLAAWSDAAVHETERRSARFYANRLADRRDALRREIESRLADATGALADRIERRLVGAEAAAEPGVAAGDEPTYAARLRDELGHHSLALFEILTAIESGAPELAHTARIEAKRLRYLLEPVVERAPEARAAVRQLKEIQDALGDLHDLDVLAAELAVAASDDERARLLRVAGAGGPVRRTPGGRRGRLALIRRIAAERDALWRAFRSGWLTGQAPDRHRLSAGLETLLTELDQSARLDLPAARDIQSS